MLVLVTEEVEPACLDLIADCGIRVRMEDVVEVAARGRDPVRRELVQDRLQRHKGTIRCGEI